MWLLLAVAAAPAAGSAAAAAAAPSCAFLFFVFFSLPLAARGGWAAASSRCSCCCCRVGSGGCSSCWALSPSPRVPASSSSASAAWARGAAFSGGMPLPCERPSGGGAGESLAACRLLARRAPPPPAAAPPPATAPPPAHLRQHAPNAPGSIAREAGRSARHPRAHVAVRHGGACCSCCCLLLLAARSAVDGRAIAAVAGGRGKTGIALAADGWPPRRPSVFRPPRCTRCPLPGGLDSMLAAQSVTPRPAGLAAVGKGAGAGPAALARLHALRRQSACLVAHRATSRNAPAQARDRRCAGWR